MGPAIVISIVQEGLSNPIVREAPVNPIVQKGCATLILIVQEGTATLILIVHKVLLIPLGSF